MRKSTLFFVSILLIGFLVGLYLMVFDAKKFEEIINGSHAQQTQPGIKTNDTNNAPIPNLSYFCQAFSIDL